MFAQALQAHLPIVLVEIANEYAVGTKWSWKYDRVIEHIDICANRTMGPRRRPDAEYPVGIDHGARFAVLTWIYMWPSHAPTATLANLATICHAYGDYDGHDTLMSAIVTKRHFQHMYEEGDATSDDEHDLSEEDEAAAPA
jgi:hypothetical protein